MRPERVGLKHHANAAPFRRHMTIRIGNSLPVEFDGSLIGFVETRNQSQHRGLPAARRPQQRGEGSGRQIEANRVERALGSEAAGNAGKTDVDHQRCLPAFCDSRATVSTKLGAGGSFWCLEGQTTYRGLLQNENPCQTKMPAL
jgi:hypothetical protein